jgi:hypothetical protein
VYPDQFMRLGGTAWVLTMPTAQYLNRVNDEPMVELTIMSIRSPEVRRKRSLRLCTVESLGMKRKRVKKRVEYFDFVREGQPKHVTAQRLKFHTRRPLDTR